MSEGSKSWHHRLQSLPAGERLPRKSLIEALITLALTAPLPVLHQLRQCLDELAIAEGEPATPALARARSAVAVFEERFKLGQSCLTAPVVARGLGVSRQRLHQLRQEDRLLGLGLGGPRGALYPAWQFGPTGRLAPGLQQLLRAARERGIEAAALHTWMETPREEFGRVAPADLLRRGEVDRIVSALPTPAALPVA